VFPGAAEAEMGTGRATGLAEDVRRYGQRIRDEAEQRIGHLSQPRVWRPPIRRSRAVAPDSCAWSAVTSPRTRTSRPRASPIRTIPSSWKGPGTNPDNREGLGRSRGGLSTKVHLVADARCRPVARLITPGQRHDSIVFETVLDQVRIARPGPGRPRRRPDRVLADKAYSSRRIRAHLRRRIRPPSPSPATRPRTEEPEAATAGAHPTSMPRSTSSETSSNAPSTSSAAPAPWPPATTSASSSTSPPSTSPRSGSGSETHPNTIHGTRPSEGDRPPRG